MSVKPSSLFMSMILLTLYLTVQCYQLKLCTDCYINDSNSYQCNGQQCESFYWPNSSRPYNIICQQSKDTCYWKRYLNDTQLYLFTACNYSMYKCADCNEQDRCYRCQIAYGFDSNHQCRRCDYMIDQNCLLCDDQYTCSTCAYGYMKNTNYSTGIGITTCLKCSFAIPGCITCDGRSSCTSCEIQYIPISGLCYQKDGKTLAKAIDYQYLLTNQTFTTNRLQETMNNLQQDMNDILDKIFIAMIVLIVVLFLGIITFCCRSTKTIEKKSLLSTLD